MTPVGTIAGGVTATVDGRGAVTPAGERWSLRWSVAAEDRWHHAADEVAVRQRLFDDTPVVETSMRVPGGDVVQRVYGARSGADDIVVVEIANESAVPVGVAVSPSARRVKLDGATVLVGRRPVLHAPKPPARVDGEWFVWPVAHRTALRLVLGAATPKSIPDVEQVVRGWKAQSDRGMRLVLPDAALESNIDAGRRLALLTQDQPLVLARFGYTDEAVAVAERLAPEVAAEADRIARSRRPDRQALLDAAAVLELAGEDQAAAVARRVAAAAGDVAPPRAHLLDVRDRLVRETDDGLEVCRVVPDEWLGQGIEVHDAPTRFGLISFAVRWHGDRPALLWDAPSGVRLTAPGLDPTWSTEAPKGDALLAPVAPPGTPVSLRRA